MDTHERKLNTARIVTVVVFCLVIGALFVLLIALPKKAGELSKLEFRVLEDYPIRKNDTAGKVMGRVVKGEFSSDVDSFLEDHFPGRSFFIALDSYYLRFTGRNADQTVVRGKNGRLFDAAVKLDIDTFESNLKTIEDFCEDNGLRLIYVNVPTSAQIVLNDLPELHLDYYDHDIIESLRVSKASYAPDLIELFCNQKDPAALLYRTDHHWTMEGAYVCYENLCTRLGLTPVSRGEFEVSRYDFRGSYYRKSGLWLTQPDSLEVWRNSTLDSLTVTIGVGEGAVTHTGVYDDSKLVPGEVDRYAAYLYSNNGLTVIENPDGNGETLMVLKDSFGNSIVPLLAMNYSRIVMIDTRSYKPNLPMPSELVEQYGIQRLLVVFGTDSSVSNVQLGYLQ